MPDPERLMDRAEEHVPSFWKEAAEQASAQNLMVLGAGLAFFGLISFGPAIAVGFGVLDLVGGEAAGDAVTGLLEDTITEQFGLVEIVEQMQDRGAQYAGLGLLTLLWPATTLASGWTRALDEIFGEGSPGPTGLKGRVRGLIPGAVLVAAVVLLFATVSFGAAAGAAQGPLMAAAIVVGGIALQFVLTMVIYHFLPSARFEWRRQWRGAVWATVGVILGTAGFAGILVFSQDFTEQYPEQLTTAIVLGLWLYVVNIALLFGALLNAVRRRRDGA